MGTEIGKEELASIVELYDAAVNDAWNKGYDKGRKDTIDDYERTTGKTWSLLACKEMD